MADQDERPTSIWLTREAAGRLEQLEIRYGNRSAAIRRAIVVLSVLETQLEVGDVLLVRRRDGREREIVIV